MSRIRGLALAGLLAGSLLVAGCATSPADKLSDDVPQAVKKPNAAQLMRLGRRSLAASKSVHIEFTAGTGAHEKYIKMEGDRPASAHPRGDQPSGRHGGVHRGR
ncbi:hypothetical protein [Nocardioides sp.]|uniref:hypothetical protein n=1 Tax=Nocardioides sp. TaxID=35761 RepID=UPI0035296F44